MEVFSFLVGTEITGKLCLQDGSLAASCSVTQKTTACTHTQEIKRQISSQRPQQHPLFWFKCKYLGTAEVCIVFILWGQSIATDFAKIVQKCQSFMQILPLCLRWHASSGLNLFPFKSVWDDLLAHQDSLLLDSAAYTVIKQNRAMCLQLPSGQSCSTSLQANCDLVE